MQTDITSHTSSGPHIPAAKGLPIEGWSLGGFDITTTVFTTWIFMVFLFAFVALFFVAIRTDHFPKLRTFGLDVTRRLYEYLLNLVGDEGIAKKFMWLLGGLMVVIFVGNIFGLLIDWLILVTHHNWFGEYLRPIYSDFNTTIVLSTVVIFTAQVLAFRLKGPVRHLKNYLFHYSGSTTTEKVVNVAVGWLHFVGEFIRIGSLSVRLFLNIFVGAILIAVAVYIGTLIPDLNTGFFQFLSLPFWFFELLVAFLQAYIFMTLSSLYIKESLPDDSHH